MEHIDGDNLLYYKNITFNKTATKQNLKGHLPVAFGYEGGWTGVGRSFLSPPGLYIVGASRKVFPCLSN